MRKPLPPKPGWTWPQKLAADSADSQDALRRTAAWWQAFWGRSWVFVTGEMRIYLDGKIVAERPGDTGSPLARGYTLQRYVQACGGRGPYPIKFNGSIFTVEPKAMGLPFNPDYRNWGDCHWWQNVRLPYHPMLAAGDIEMMDPLFRMYESVRPLCEARAKSTTAPRAAIFPKR